MNKETNQALKPGTLLHHGIYKIDRIIGQGGFGITYLATDTGLHRHVAIKEFFPKDFCDRDNDTSHVTPGTQNTAELVSRLKAKFLKEARNISKLRNPSIISIYAAFETNNTAYYVMEYIEGVTLSEMVKQSGPLSEEKALRYIEKIGNALEYVHDKKINHLDVKPANIIVRTSDDEPILIDFGLSKQYDLTGHQTSTTPTGISHGFAPMEQYNAGGVSEFSPQTDIYSLAATLYYLLTGSIPPPAPRLIEDELPFPDNISPYIVRAISKAMSSGRKKRHDTVKDFLADLSTKADPDEATVLINEKSCTATKKTHLPPPVATAEVEAEETQLEIPNETPVVPPAPPQDTTETTPTNSDNTYYTYPKKKSYKKGCIITVVVVLCLLACGAMALYYYIDSWYATDPTMYDSESIYTEYNEYAEEVAAEESKTEYYKYEYAPEGVEAAAPEAEAAMEEAAATREGSYYY